MEMPGSQASGFSRRRVPRCGVVMGLRMSSFVLGLCLGLDLKSISRFRHGCGRDSCFEILIFVSTSPFFLRGSPRQLVERSELRV